MQKSKIDLACLAIVAFVAAASAATFVSPQDKSPANGAAAVFERRFGNDGAVRRATWAVTAQGVFEAFANGRRVGNDFLKPGVTECGRCRHEYSYDVTGMLDRRAGATNVLSATVTPGWWCDQMMRPSPDAKPAWQLGREIAFRGELRLELEDGSFQTVGTDEKWLAAYTGPVVSAGIYEGEVYDARRTAEGLKGVRLNTEFSGEIRPAAAKVTLREDLVMKPREACVVKGAEGAAEDAFGVAKVVRRSKGDEKVRLEPGEMLVVDFGQNCSAVPSFDVEGEAGAELEIRTSEMLNESNGEKSRGNDGPAGTPYLASLRDAYAGIRYTLKDGPQSYMPRYTYFGYRYLGVTTTRPVVFSRWRSTPVSSVTRTMMRGTLVTGNERVNRLVSNIVWGMLSNYLSSPTDCPQRDERLGWTADTQVFMDSAAYLADTREFLGKFLADLRDAQCVNGCYKCFVPNVRHVFAPWGSAGWTDAGVIIPYRLWKWYGERRFVDESWDSMVRYMSFLESDAEPYRINHGDWLAFEHHVKLENNLSGDAMDKRQVKALNAYFRVWMAMLMREMAAATGRGEAERHYADEEKKLRQAFAEGYVGPDGTIKDEYKGQCNDLYMLKLGLCGGPAAVEATKRDLVANIKAHGDRLQTGFLGTAILLPTLTFEADAPELAYSLLLQDAFPSWLYSVDQGATTVWERWNGYTKEKGFGPVGMNSFNHYAYGCVLEWLFSAVAGIRPDPEQGGWRRFRLRPYPDRRLGSCSAAYRSDFGVIRSEWQYDEDGRLVWRFSVPKGSTAVVTWVDGTVREYSAGGYELRSEDNKPCETQESSSISRIENRTKDLKRDPGLFGDYWWANRFLSRHQAVESVKGRTVDVVMLGDSIMHFWEWKHPKSWAKFTKGRTVLNLGYGGDRTQNVIWRINHGELDGYTAKCVVLMIGTNNNTFEDSDPANVAAAIEKIVGMIRSRQPEAKIVLHPVFPRGRSSESAKHARARARNDKTNALLEAFAKKDGKLVWIDFNAKLVDESGWVPKSIMADEIHPTDAGYDIWMEALAQ